MRVCVLLAVLSLLVPAAQAAPRREASDELERLELAREHFQKGEQLQAQGKLEAALLELELAEVAHPSASVTEAKQRVRAQLEAQRTQLAAPVPRPAAVQPTAPSQRPLRRFIAPIIVAPLALGALVAGGALLGTMRSDYARLETTCSPACDPDAVAPLRTRERAGVALLAAGGALAALDVVLWALLARRPAAERGPRASLLLGPGVAAAGLAGRF